MKTISQWSFSRLIEYEKCPFAAWLGANSGVKKDLTTNPAAARGIAIHTEAEKFVDGTGPFTANLRHYEAEFNVLREGFQSNQVGLEGNWGFDVNWAPTDWWGDNVWARIKLDSIHHLDSQNADVIDYKTGKSFGNEVKHGQQTEIYAIGAFFKYPELMYISTQLWYLDEKARPKKKLHTRAQAMKYWPRYHARALAMTEATEFPAKPNKFNCKWCDFRPSLSDLCPYGYTD